MDEPLKALIEEVVRHQTRDLLEALARAPGARTAPLTITVGRTCRRCGGVLTARDLAVFHRQAAEWYENPGTCWHPDVMRCEACDREDAEHLCGPPGVEGKNGPDGVP